MTDNESDQLNVVGTPPGGSANKIVRAGDPEPQESRIVRQARSKPVMPYVKIGTGV